MQTKHPPVTTLLTCFPRSCQAAPVDAMKFWIRFPCTVNLEVRGMKCFSTKQGSLKTFSGIFLTCVFGFVASSQTPTNDSFSDALLIGGVGGDFTGGNEGATKE